VLNNTGESMNKKHSERNAGRKPTPDGVRFSGGMMPRELYEWVMRGINGIKGMALVKVALEFYREHHTH